MKTIVFFIFTFASSLTVAIEIVIQSEEIQTQVIELYTSEGCSSCPPADRWLTSQKSNPHLFKDFIPVAFHVDYWDYLGWKDKLALPQNSNRQRLHKHLNNLNSVYTPGVLKAGKEWRSWRSSSIIKPSDVVGTLDLEIKDNKLKAKFDAVNQGQYKLVVALLGMNIDTKVLAGENRGETLKHDFVLLKQHSFKASKGQWDELFDTDFFKSDYQNTALVAWIETPNNPAPIQAVGTYL